MGPKSICCTKSNRSVCGSLQINSSTYSVSFDKKTPLSLDEKMFIMDDISRNNKPNAGQRLRRCSRNFEAAKQPMLVLEQWFRQRLANWVQCAGHEGTILPATETTIWKKRTCKDCSYESNAYSKLMKDPYCCKLVPKFYQELFYEGNFYMELDDLTKKFKSPSIMDIKMGERTFLECEVSNCTKRHDLYEKMIAIDPNEPTAQEKEEAAITKLRYMQFRERESSSSTLGFRIEAIKKRNEKEMNSNFTTCKTKSQVTEELNRFFGSNNNNNNNQIRKKLVRRLKHMRSQIENSTFFKTHEIIGSSLLIMYDDSHVGAWLIDFAKTVPLPEGMTVTHRAKWQYGNREDGYLTGLDNFIEILESNKPIS